jgi:hypothetical protein
VASAFPIYGLLLPLTLLRSPVLLFYFTVYIVKIFPTGPLSQDHLGRLNPPYKNIVVILHITPSLTLSAILEIGGNPIFLCPLFLLKRDLIG